MLFRPIDTTGDGPGWISQHETRFDPDTSEFSISGGKIDHGDDYVENFDDWKLDMTTWNWSRVTRHRIARWKFQREDDKPVWLDAMRSGRYSSLLADVVTFDEYAKTRPKTINRDLLATVFDPPGEFTPPENPLSPYRSTFSYLIHGIEIIFEERNRWIMMTVKGSLPEELVRRHVALVVDRLSQLEGTVCTAHQIITP